VRLRAGPTSAAASPREPDPAWHALEMADVVRELAADAENGLPSADAAARLEKYGPNELKEAAQRTLLQMVLGQFQDVVVWVLLVATAISMAMGESADAVVIILIVIINAALGVVQERKAEQSLAKLKRMAAPTARVVRSAEAREVASRDLVRGDLILLEAGGFVPADARLVETANLRAEEAALTGESVPVDKTADVLLAEDVSLGDRLNMVFAGTAVSRGRGRAIVVATADATQLGQIAEMLGKIKEEATPLQQKLEGLGRWLALVTLGICGIVFLAGSLRSYPLFDMFMTSVSLAVAAIPEGLPAVVTIVLALGMQNMVQRHVIIRRLRAVEALGSVTVICTDKTGTLTQNEMTVRRFWTRSRSGTVTGAGYSARGEFSHMGEPLEPGAEPELRTLLQIAALCNDARLEETGGHFDLIGDPTEGALLAFAAKGGCSREAEEQVCPRVLEIPFDPERKRMSTIHALAEPLHGGGSEEARSAGNDRRIRILVKGAPDLILEVCGAIQEGGGQRELTEADREVVRTNYLNYARQALRVLGFAYRDLPALPHDMSPAMLERDLVFVGLVGMIDPPRSEVRPAVLTAREAGIRTVMVTGDYPDTALAIANELELAEPGARVIDGRALRKLSEDELAAGTEDIALFARVSPADKMRIVEAYQRRGEIVAMTGDGLNDAPALKRAEVGVAMGRGGTDVARDASDMVLADDNFASIVAAVEEGRGIFENIRKFVFYLLSCNISEVLTIFVCILAGLPRPLVPVQILWVNLVTDGLPALALGVDPKEPGLMKRPPRDPKEGVMTPRTIRDIVWYGCFMTVATLGAYLHGLYWRGLVPAGYGEPLEAWQKLFDLAFWHSPAAREGLFQARTFAFTTMAFSQLAQSLNCRSETHSIFRLGLFSNYRLLGAIAVSFIAQLVVIYMPAAQEVFDTRAIDSEAVLVVAAFSVSPLAFGEIRKALLRRRLQPDAPAAP
jgi:Ca2+-transporting ATPase